MKVLRNKKLRNVLLHILFWIGIWFFFYYFFSYNYNNTAYVVWFSSFLLPLTIIVTYFFVYFLIPRFLLTKYYLKFALYSFYVLVVSSYAIVLILYGCVIFLLHFNTENIPQMGKNFYFILILVYMVVVVVSFVSLLNQNFKTSSRNKELHNKILATQLQLKEQELQYLKMQIQPHFLFNTLNTIYGLALKQSQQAPDVILKLSNLLDYILYQIEKPRVSLREEIVHIQEYIELEKIRFKDTLDVSFNVQKMNSEIQIAPMLLLPFVENSFKHGSIIKDFLKIEVNVEMDDLNLEFRIKNTYIENNESKKGGIGLENVKKRLELYYKNNYSLEFKCEDNWYNVRLIIYNLNLHDEENKLPDS